MKDFRNEPILDLRLTAERRELLKALERLDRSLPIDVPVVIAGERRTRADFSSIDPGATGRTVAQVASAAEAEVEEAVRVASEAGRTWRSTPVEERAALLLNAAGVLRDRRYELAALAVRECAKPWTEADAEVCEAIDFIEYYARAALRLGERASILQVPGEINRMEYRGRGVVAVIGPWNFPLAIPNGMSVAALAAGNAVCLKPAEQSPACALALVDALLEAGLPPGVVSLLPGAGEVGAALVRHPGVHTIAFTGSSAVGTEIYKAAAEVRPGQRHLKHCVIEMGGKNCSIVDADADLDDAVPALLAAGFGYAGQKCSATSRILAHRDIAGALTERLLGALETLKVGQAEDFDTDVPPVIEAEARDRLAAAVDEARARDCLVGEATIPEAEGFFVAPAFVVEPPADTSVVGRELFGPVVTIETVTDLSAAFALVDEQQVALTGAFFSRNPRAIREATARTPVGNFYVNQSSTGAMVGRQPFGGNRLSGNGTKAGGPDYLLHFVEPVVVSENVVRHGLAM